MKSIRHATNLICDPSAQIPGDYHAATRANRLRRLFRFECRPDFTTATPGVTGFSLPNSAGDGLVIESGERICQFEEAMRDLDGESDFDDLAQSGATTSFEKSAAVRRAWRLTIPLLGIHAMHFSMTLLIGLRLGMCLAKQRIPSHNELAFLAVCAVVQVLLSASHAAGSDRGSRDKLSEGRDRVPG